MVCNRCTKTICDQKPNQNSHATLTKPNRAN